MPAVTVLTAVRNGKKYLPETIESIRNQTFKDWEYIIVDDSSTDSTVEIIQKFQDKDKRIQLIQLDKSVGPYGAANVGLNKANGKYVVRTDGDDVSLPDRIEKQIHFLRSNPNLRACASYAQRIDENSKVLENRIVKSTLTSGSMKWYLFLRCPLVHSTACVEKKVFDEMGGYNPSFASQDYRMWCYLATRGIVAQIPEILVYFRLTTSGISLSKRECQEELGLKVAQDHIFDVTGEKWSFDRIESLKAIGLVKKNYPVSKAIQAAREWDRHWIADKTLSEEERAELTSISTFLRKTFLRRNRRRQLLAVAMNVNSYLFPLPKMKGKPQKPKIVPY